MYTTVFVGVGAMYARQNGMQSGQFSKKAGSALCVARSWTSSAALDRAGTTLRPRARARVYIAGEVISRVGAPGYCGPQKQALRSRVRYQCLR